MLPRGGDPARLREAGATSVLCHPDDASRVEASGLVSVTPGGSAAGTVHRWVDPSAHVEEGDEVVLALARARYPDASLLSAASRVLVAGTDLTAVGAAVAVLRRSLPPAVAVGANAPDALWAAALLVAGADDLGDGDADAAGAGDALAARREALVEAAAQAGVRLVERGAVVVRDFEGRPKVLLDLVDGHGLVRPRHYWASGDLAPPHIAPGRHSADDVTRGVRPRLAEVLDGAAGGERPSRDEVELLFSARGEEVDAVCEVADRVRERQVGDTVSFVVCRNIQYTNMCTYRCRFCAFSKGPRSLNLRGDPYLMDIAEVVDRSVEAWERGATEVCMQGGIHPEFTGQFYLDVCAAVKERLPDMHVHAFSALEVWQGAHTLGLPLVRFLTLLQEAGLSSLPGTAAEILDDDIRRVICPDKVTTMQWVEVQRAAAQAGLRSNATIMFGHVEGPPHWANHLDVVARLQAETGHLTELVPLPFVHMAAPLYLQGRSRPGPTWDESVLMHAVSRLALQGLIDNIQVSWVKLGEEGARRCLHAGCNDLGGTLMNESISRSAGASHGQEMDPHAMERLILSAGRVPRQRTTLYENAPRERIAAARRAAPLAERALTPVTLRVGTRVGS